MMEQKKIQIKDAVIQLCKGRKSLCQKPDHFSTFQSSTGTASESKAALIFRGLREGAGWCCGAIIPWDLPTFNRVPYFFCLSQDFWLWQSDLCHSSAPARPQQKDQSNGCKHQSKKKVSKMGSCWVFLEDEMKLGLCKFKLGRNLLFLINWWILQRFYFINIKTLCKR